MSLAKVNGKFLEQVMAKVGSQGPLCFVAKSTQPSSRESFTRSGTPAVGAMQAQARKEHQPSDRALQFDAISSSTSDSLETPKVLACEQLRCDF